MKIKDYLRITPYGLVLSGGGAKGAYQIGILKAFDEEGLLGNIKVVSGTSIGALNAYMLKHISLKLIEKIYLEGSAQFLAISTMKQEYHDKAIDTTNLYKFLKSINGKDFLDFRTYVCARNISRKPAQVEYFCLDNINDQDKVIRCVMASSAMPIAYKKVLIDKDWYSDGGWEEKIGDNTPVRPIIKNHKNIDTIVVIHLRKNFDKNVSKIYSNKNIIEIVPERKIERGGMLSAVDARSKVLRKLLKEGYSEGKDLLEEEYNEK